VARRTHEDYRRLVAQHGRKKAQEIALEAIRRKHPPKRERIEVR
jgi:hypothetical protein